MRDRQKVDVVRVRQAWSTVPEPPDLAGRITSKVDREDVGRDAHGSPSPERSSTVILAPRGTRTSS